MIKICSLCFLTLSVKILTLFISLWFTSLCAQSFVFSWDGVVLLCLWTCQLPVQFVHFDILSVAPATHPILQSAL